MEKMTIPQADRIVGELQAKSYECDRYKHALERIADSEDPAHAPLVRLALEALRRTD